MHLSCDLRSLSRLFASLESIAIASGESLLRHETFALEFVRAGTGGLSGSIAYDARPHTTVRPRNSRGWGSVHKRDGLRILLGRILFIGVGALYPHPHID